jgi:hypothetical protein
MGPTIGEAVREEGEDGFSDVPDDVSEVEPLALPLNAPWCTGEPGHGLPVAGDAVACRNREAERPHVTWLVRRQERSTDRLYYHISPAS